MIQKIKCFFGKHIIVHKEEELSYNILHTYECKFCGKVEHHFCIPKPMPSNFLLDHLMSFHAIR